LRYDLSPAIWRLLASRAAYRLRQKEHPAGRPRFAPTSILWATPMIKWILILLIVAAVASLLGFPMLAGAAATGARLLIGVVLVLFLLVIFGLIAVS